MRIPNGFIKESSTGLYKRNGYIFDGHKIVKESTLLPTKEEVESISERNFTSLDECIREVLAYSGDIGQEPRTTDIYVAKEKESYKVVKRLSDKVVAIIDPQNNVYETKLTEIPEQTDKSLAPDKDTAKAPKDVKEFPSKPKELKETEIRYTKEVSGNGDSVMFTDDTSDYEAILQYVNDYAPKGTKPEDCTIKHFDTPVISNTSDYKPKEEDVKEILDYAKGLEEADDHKWTLEMYIDGELSYKGKMNKFDLDEVVSTANSICGGLEFNTKYWDSLKEGEVDTKKSYTAKEIYQHYLKKGKSKEEAAKIVAGIFTLPEVTEKDTDIPSLIKKLEEADEEEVTEEVNDFPSEEPVEEPAGANVNSLESTYFIRRPENLTVLQDKIDKHITTLSSYKIEDSIKLTPEEYDEYASNLRVDKEFLTKFRPKRTTDADFICIEVTSPDRPTLLIDNSDSSSAQYIGIK